MKNYIIPQNQKKLRKAAIEKRECWTKKKLQNKSKLNRSKSKENKICIEEDAETLLKKRNTLVRFNIEDETPHATVKME